MNVYVGVPVGVLAVFVAVLGVLAIRSGWLLPPQRKHILRPRLFGYAQLLVAAGLAAQLAAAVAFSSDQVEGSVRFAGLGVMLVAPGLIWAAQRPARATAG